MYKFKILMIILFFNAFPNTIFSQKRIFQVTGASLEMNIAPSFRDRSSDQFLRNNFYFSIYEKVNFKAGYGLLSMYEPDASEGSLYSINMRILSLTPFIQPINSKWVKVQLGAGISEMKYHSYYADMWGPMDIGDGPFLAQHILNSNIWRTAVEFCIDLDFRITDHLLIGCQGGFFDFLDKKQNIPDGFYTAGLKVKYQFETKNNKQ